ncbi:potassium voltage-gated channel protein egl-36-like [Saccostrea echinata]|uniref:potassium voltage-gated channel protein egl-36-like n=1 Tax=Saccostrea echinata TaxID=191078 RepID=UPI002A7FB599|nr:potassium voltage-gated channel protein egl-36-like [Saccostrea echinata]
MENAIIDLNLNGRVFRLKRSTFQRLPIACLEYGEDGQGEVYLERHADCFDAVLWYFTNGELHMPNSICPAVFKKELEFWSVDPSKLSQCCYMKYLSFFEDQKLLKTFEEDEKKSTGVGKPPKIGRSKLEKFQSKVWRTLDDPSSSVAAKIYVGVSAFVILMSIFVLCVSTHPAFQRELQYDELEAYYSSDPEKLAQVKGLRNKPIRNSDDSKVKKVSPISPIKVNHTFLPDRKLNNTIASDHENQTADLLPPPNTVARYTYLDYLDYGMVTYFGVELIIRITFCPKKSKFFSSLLNIIDVIAFSSEVATMTFEYIFPKEKYIKFSALDIVECIQIARVFRLFRLVKNFIGFRILIYSVRASLKNMLLMIFNLLVAALIFSSIGFYSDRATFESIPDAIWWAIVTMTTVGYGDSYPKNIPGRFIGCLCAISGIFVIAVSIPVLVNNYILFTGFANLPIKRHSEGLTSLLKSEFDSRRERKHSQETEPMTSIQSS